MSSPLVSAAVVAGALVLGSTAGFFGGRAMLERQWRSPFEANAKVLRPMPINKSRAALAELTASDPAVVDVAAVGADDSGLELHVQIENRGKCTITKAAGVAYAFDPYGMPTRFDDKGDEHIAFTLDAPVEPGKKVLVAKKLGDDARKATLALAQVDTTTCADGSTWKR